jgi:uncharacterized protein (UPF0261 family)
MGGRIYVVGAMDTKGEELRFVRDRLADRGLETVLVDIGTRRPSADADIAASEVAGYQPQPAVAIFESDRGTAVAAMGRALRAFLETRDDIGGIIGLGGSGGTSMIAPALQDLAIGLPKIIVSAVAASDIRPYVGLSDIVMIPSVTDIDRLNRISRVILANAAGALAGMVAARSEPAPNAAAAVIGITTAGVTTECQERVMDRLGTRYECVTFHAAGTGGPTLEKLALSGQLDGIIDIATTEVTDFLLGGMFACDGSRLESLAAAGIPYVGSCGALDCLKFRAPDTVPAKYRQRTTYAHNPEVTLVLPSADEYYRIGKWIAEKLNRSGSTPVRFLLPLGGTSSINREGQPFYDHAANDALFQGFREHWIESALRELIVLPFHVNDPEFADAIVDAFREISC